MTKPQKNLSLGKNSETPPYRWRHRATIRQATAQRLVSGYWATHDQNLKGSSVAGCGRWRAFQPGEKSNLGNAQIAVTPDRAKMQGHFVCGCNWTCEVCASATVARNRSWIRAALLPALEAQGLACSLVTLTLAHSYNDDWAKPVVALRAAWGLSDRRLSKAYKKAGCVGKFKALEMPVGEHGAHPHIHVLVTHDKDADLVALEAAMQEAWFKAVPEVGGRCNAHGFDFKANAAADYVTKMETAHEMAAQSTKLGRKKGRSLSQLLDAAGRGDLQAGAEWQRAIKAVGASNRFHAGSLPKNLGIPCPSEWEDEPEEEDDDAEPGEAVEPVEPVIIEYPLDDHLKATHPALGRPGLAMILRAARRAGESGVLRMVKALCNEYTRKNTCRALDAGEAWAVEPDIIAVARSRPLMPEEIPAYLAAKKARPRVEEAIICYA